MEKVIEKMLSDDFSNQPDSMRNIAMQNTADVMKLLFGTTDINKFETAYAKKIIKGLAETLYIAIAIRTIESSCADIIISWNDYISNGERLFPSVLAEQIFLMMKAFDIAYYHKSIMEDIPTTRGIDCSVRVLQTEYKVKLSFRWVTNKELRKYLKKVPESVVESVEQCAICREIKPWPFLYF